MVLYCKAFAKAADTNASSMTGGDRYGFEMSAVTAGRTATRPPGVFCTGPHARSGPGRPRSDAERRARTKLG